MIVPQEREFGLSAGSFRGLEWPGGPSTAVFLHGLSGVADVWSQTVDGLGPNRPRCIAIDQRGHGHSPRPPHQYAAGDYVRDVRELVSLLGGPVLLVGHSMGARVALVAAARCPELFTSVAIVDIGPEAWRANIRETVAALARMPESFASRDEAVAYGSRGRRGPVDAEQYLLPRLQRDDAGGYRWLASREALIETVTLHRSRNYWADWERITIPALLVRGETSSELRPRIASEMRRRNPKVRFIEIPGTGHNIPLIEPAALGRTLAEFWNAEAGA